MITKSKRQQIVESFEDKEYRDIYVSESIDVGLPFQIRAMRRDRGWSQQEFADRLGMKQGAVSRLESPNYGRFALATLKRIASALDVALVVQFAPFSELAERQANLSPEDLAVPDFEHDPGLVPSDNYLETRLTARSPSPVSSDLIRPDLWLVPTHPVSNPNYWETLTSRNTDETSDLSSFTAD